MDALIDFMVEGGDKRIEILKRNYVDQEVFGLTVTPRSGPIVNGYRVRIVQLEQKIIAQLRWGCITSNVYAIEASKRRADYDRISYFDVAVMARGGRKKVHFLNV